MSTNPNEPTGSNIFNFLPGTIVAPGIEHMNIGGVSGDYFQISHNLSTRIITKETNNPLYIAEFDDSLVDMAWWAGPRYKGVKSTGKKINTYTGPIVESGIGSFQIGPGGNTAVSQNLSAHGPVLTIGNYPDVQTYPGDQTYGLNPVIQNESTAIYIANTVIGGNNEDPQFATIQNHSYIGISKILIVNVRTDTVEVLDRGIEKFEDFHRFITNDLSTGTSFQMKVLDESISTKLKAKYHCKMNKGWLLKTFDFKHAGEFSGSKIAKGEDHLDTANSMFFYRDGEERRDAYKYTGFDSSGTSDIAQSPVSGARFRYALIEMFSAQSPSTGPLFEQTYMGPSFTSSSIVSNKYTRQFYSGSYGVIENRFNVGNSYAQKISNSDLGIASRFIGVNCLDFLRQNNSNPNLTEEEKVELHVTFLQGVKDFSIGISGSGTAGNYKNNDSANDERSIGTFEVDQNQTALDIGDHCHSFLPETHEITFKGSGDGRFMPSMDTFEELIFNGYLQYTGSAITQEESRAIASSTNESQGCTTVGEGPLPNAKLQRGINISRVKFLRTYIEGGALGPVGHISSQTSSNNTYNKSISGSMTADNYYGGYVNSAGTASLDWQLSFLDKDHTIIADVNKDEELFDGIGSKGVAILPENSHIKVKQNLYIYLKKAGLIDNAPEGISNIIIE